MIGTVTDLGVSRSGVREIAQSRGAGNPEGAARTVLTMNRVVGALGLIGTLAMIVLAAPISRLTFASRDHATAIALLSAAMLLTVLTGLQVAKIQGMGRIPDLARLNLLGGVLGFAATVVLVLVWGEASVVPVLIAGSGCALAAAWIYGRRVALPRVRLSWGESLRSTRPLIRLGLSIMNGSLLSALVAYVARVLIARDLGTDAVGLYLCAFILAGKFVTILIEAMWTDFYPRAAAAGGDAELNRLVNQQTEIALLMAMPGLLATLLFAPWMVRLFYSAAFEAAAPLMRLFTLGYLFAVICGPLRIIQLVKNRSLLHAAAETWSSGLHCLLIYLFLRQWGLTGCAAAYIVHYSLQTALSLFLAHRLTGFRWSGGTIRMLATFLATALGGYAAATVLPEGLGTAGLGAAVSLVAGLTCLRFLALRLGPEHALSRSAGRLPILGRWLSPERTLPARTEHRDAA
jgi:PST family polysaccharide transporter